MFELCRCWVANFTSCSEFMSGSETVAKNRIEFQWGSKLQGTSSEALVHAWEMKNAKTLYIVFYFVCLFWALQFLKVSNYTEWFINWLPSYVSLSKLTNLWIKGVLHLWTLFLKTLCIFSKNKATSDKVSHGSGQKCSKELENYSFTSVETIVVKLQWKMCENQYFPCFEP